MEKPSDLEKKYHIIATEYSKVRSQATVLKKAVLDEQSKNVELRELIKDLEQKVRKDDQEIDSLTFRNEQLTKRISVLQQELQVSTHSKKGKSKQVENVGRAFDIGILDEELHKKILENAELVSTMVDKDLEIANYKEKTSLLEQKICHVQKEMCDIEERHKKELEKLKQTNLKNITPPTPTITFADKQEKDNADNFLRQEVERWRVECELLRAKPETINDQDLVEYYEFQIKELLESKQMAQSETNSLWAENTALSARLEQLSLEKSHLENSILSNVEELHTTSDNYKNQLDAMTEHLAAQNEKITRQCDEIQLLKHRLSLKKKSK